MKDNPFLCAYCSCKNGYNVYHTDYHKISDQRDRLLKLLKMLYEEYVNMVGESDLIDELCNEVELELEEIIISEV